MSILCPFYVHSKLSALDTFIICVVALVTMSLITFAILLRNCDVCYLLVLLFLLFLFHLLLLLFPFFLCHLLFILKIILLQKKQGEQGYFI